MHGFEVRVQGFEVRVHGFEVRVHGFEVRVHGFEVARADLCHTNFSNISYLVPVIDSLLHTLVHIANVLYSVQYNIVLRFGYHCLTSYNTSFNFCIYVVYTICMYHLPAYFYALLVHPSALSQRKSTFRDIA